MTHMPGANSIFAHTRWKRGHCWDRRPRADMSGQGGGPLCVCVRMCVLCTYTRRKKVEIPVVASPEVRLARKSNPSLASQPIETYSLPPV